MQMLKKTASLNLCSILLALLLVCSASPALAAGLSGAEFDAPALITSIGQSADGQLVKVLADRIGLNYSYDSTAAPGSVKDFKTLILVLGGSSKGLGAAGINPEQEEQRARALISAAKEAGVKIIAMHVGGEARRGDLTDRFVSLTAPSANYIIAVAEGNKDGIFTNIAGGSIPIDLPDSIGDAGRFMKAAFR
jgi:hypothetical protein